MKVTPITIALSLALLPNYLSAQTKKMEKPREQTSFCEAGIAAEFNLKPIPLPSTVLDALMNTPQIKRALAGTGGQLLDRSALFKGTKVRLSDSQDSVFVVMGLSPMSGADNTWFWIVRQSKKGAPKVLLFAGANCLNVMATKTLGYRDIVATWSSASSEVREEYTFDGKTYRSRLRKSRPIS